MSWNPHIIRAFELLFRPWMKRRIAAQHVRGAAARLIDDRPVMVVANHTSWWDAFLIRELHRRLGTGPMFTLMSERELNRFPFFRRMGVIGVEPSPGALRRVLRDLQQYAGSRVEQRGGPRGFWLLVFAQGSIWPSWKRPLGFRAGIELFSEILSPCTVLPVGLHLEPMNRPSPSAFIGIAEPFAVEKGNAVEVAKVEQRVESVLDDLYRILAEHGEAAPSIWRTALSVPA